MAKIVRAGQTGAADNLDSSQATFREQIAAITEAIRQLGGNANIASGSTESTDPLTAPFVLYVNPYIGRDTFAAGSYNTKEAASGSTTEAIVAQKLKRLENQRLTCGYTRHAPFKTINRAVIEAAIITSKNWYINDPLAHVDCVCIALAPGLHIAYNNPAADGTAVSTWTDGFEPTWQQLVAFNPAEGGILLPRGASILSEFGDLRHTIVRPNYVPSGNVDETPTYTDGVATYALRRQVFKTTGGGYAYGITAMDKLGFAETHHLLSLFGHATKTELDAFYANVYTACGSGGNLSQALLVARGTEYTIAAPISGTPTQAWDSTASASFYIFQCSVRSNYGMGRLWVDGSKVLGFKSFVLANFTGVSLQKSISEQGDMRCWQKYSGGNWVAVSNYADYIAQAPDNIRMNPARRSVGVGAINEGFVQKVSIFDIGEGAQSFVDTGGEIDSNNGNSSFGGCAGLARGYRRAALPSDKSWQVSAIKVPLSVEAKTGNIQRIYLGKVTAFTSSTITLDSGLAPYGSSSTVPNLLGQGGYTLPSGSYIWVENAQGADWRAPLTSAAWSSTTPTQLNINSAITDPSGGAVGNGGNGISLAVGARVYVRRLVDTRSPAERRLSLKLSNTTAARIPAASSVLQTDTSSSSIARALSSSTELLLVTATGLGSTPGSGVLKTAEVTLRRGGSSVNYANNTFYRAGTVVLYGNKHYVNSKELTTASAVPDLTKWQETFVHMESSYAPEDNLKNEAPILIFDTDTDGADDTTTCGINWSTVWTTSAAVYDQYRTGTDYLGAFLLLTALGYSATNAHAALIPRVEASRERNPALTSSPTTTLALSSTTPAGGAANAAANWPIEFRRPSTLWMGSHRWFGSGTGNYSKAVPAAAQDMSAQNKFTYYFTSQGGGRVIPQGSQEDGLLVSPRGLEDTTTGQTLTVEGIGASDINTSQSTSFPSLSVGELTVTNQLTFGSTILTTNNPTSTTSTSAGLGLTRLANIAQLTATGTSALVASSNAAIDTTPSVVTIGGLNRWRQAQRLISANTDSIIIYVDASKSDRDLNSMRDTPPSSAAQAIPSLARAAEYANDVIGSSSQAAEIRIVPGLYDPNSTWICNVVFVAYKPAFSALNWVSNSVGNASTPNNNFDGSGHADRVNSVNFWSYRLVLRDSLSSGNEMHINIQPRQMTFNRGVTFVGGFHFLGIPECIKAVSQGALPSASFLGGFDSSFVMPAASYFTTAIDTNIDTLINQMRIVNSRNASYGSWVAGSLIALRGGTTDLVVLRDLVFGPGLPSHKDDLGGVRPAMITIEGSSTVNIFNVYIRGKSKITSAGMGVTTALPLANVAHYGSAEVAAPWTWTQTYHTFIGVPPGSPQEMSIAFGSSTNYDIEPTRVNGFTYYADATGKLLPNHIHLLDSSGVAPTTNDSGPFFDQFIHAPNALFVPLSWVDYREAPLTVKRQQGFVGKFGSNGYNSTKTRGVLGGNASITNEETGFTFNLSGFIGNHANQGTGSSPCRSIFTRAGIDPSAASSTGRVTYSGGSPDQTFGQATPSGLNPVITTDSSGSTVALNVGLRSYRKGINSEHAITIPATNVVL